MPGEIENQLLEGVPVNRRGFVKKVLLGTAFAVPAIVSFDMRSLSAFAADCVSPNQTEVLTDSSYQVQLLPTGATGKLQLKVKVRDAGSLANVGSPTLHVRLRKIKPKPHRAPDLPVKFDFSRDSGGPHYALKLDTSKWDDGVYTLRFTVGTDPVLFSVVTLVGGC